MGNTEFAFKIDGIDILPYVAGGGIEWSRADVDSENSGLLQNGDLRRDRIIVRRQMNVSIMPLTTEQMKIVQQAIYPQWVEVEFLCPLEGEVVTRIFSSGNVASTAAFQRTLSDGSKITMWKGFRFPLIEKGGAGV